MANPTQGRSSPRMDELWDRFMTWKSTSGDLVNLIKSGNARWALGTAPDVFGRTLCEEDVVRRKRPQRRLSSPIEEWTTLRTTQRIDGVLPLTVPVPGDLRSLGNEMLRETARLNMDVPSPDDAGRLRDEIAICYLAILHRRKLRLRFQLDMELLASCPQSTDGEINDQLMLMGKLPLGGRVVVFYSSLDATEWAGMGPGAVEHSGRLHTARNEGGGLQLVERPGAQS